MEDLAFCEKHKVSYNRKTIDSCPLCFEPQPLNPIQGNPRKAHHLAGVWNAKSRYPFICKGCGNRTKDPVCCYRPACRIKFGIYKKQGRHEESI